jgi:chemotaxis protein histidine kinase CheA
MIKNNVYYEWFASITVPNPDQVGYWVDLGADSKGRIIKVYNHDIEKWIVLFDVSKDDYVPPFIGSNGNWWVDNRDTGVKATAETPYIGDNDHWFTYDPINKVYVDTGIEARGLSAYDIAVKLGFKGSEQDWIDSLSKASEDAAIAALEAANKANEAADKANQAVEEIEGIVDDAIAATDKAEEIASNPPKIVDGDWWIYDYDTKQYVNTGIAAIGDAFTYKKEYPSVEAMEADWGTADVKLGEYVLINTNNVEDPDDAKVYLKTQEGWKFIVDLSGMQGIQGWSAYEVAVKHGFVGTEEEWVQSLKQPALDAAAEALDAKAKVEATEQAVKEAEALRVTAEQGRVNAENTRVSNENTRISNEDSRKAEEAKRVTAETSRKEAESSRVNAESDRVEAEGARAAAEQLRANSESERVTAETSRKEEEAKRVEAETARDTAEQERISNEATRQANEAVRETQEAAREKNTSDAITAVNEAKTAAQQATTNATTAANNANTQAARAKEYADNPPKVGEDGYWYLWDEVNDVYVNTGWPSSGIILKGRLNSPEELGDIVDPQLSDSYIVGTDLYFWNGTEWVNMGRFQGPQGEPGKDAELSKAAIEAVLVGEVTTHTHDTRYYTKDQTDANIKVVADDLANNYYNKSQVDSKFTSVYIFKGSVDTIEDLPTEGNVIGDVWNVRKNDTNYAWTSEGWDALGCTVELSSLTSNGLMSKEDFAKLQGIEAGAQVNKIETITKRVLLNVVDKNVTIPEDIAISPDEPTNNEIIWMDTDEDYDFTFDGYSKVDADARFVHQVEGKDLSTNDYSNADKNKVNNLNSYVTSGSFAQDANNAAITLNIKDPVTDNNSNQVLTINKATSTTAGVMSAADKTKLDAALTASDNIATATKLATARTIWGQAFDGSANISGNMTNVDHIYMNNSHTIYVKDTNGNNLDAFGFSNTNNLHIGYGLTAKGYNTYINSNEIYFRTSANNVERMRITSDGKVGIGTTAPDANLHVSGNKYNIKLNSTTGSTEDSAFIWGSSSNKNTAWRIVDNPTSGLWLQYGVSDADTHNMTISGMNATNLNALRVKAKNLTVNGSKVWHAGNDGAGSGLDADLLDGYHINNIQLGGWYNFVTYQYIDNVTYYNWIKLLDLSQIETDGYIEVEIDVPGDNNYPTLEKLFIKVSRFNDNNKYNSISLKVNGLLDNQIEVLSKIDNNKTVWICIKSAWNGNKSRIRLVGQESININLSSLTTQTNEPEGGSEIIHGKGGIRLDLVTNTFRYYYEPNFNEEDLAYWYENNENASSTTCLTGGNRNVIESLRNKFKRCIAKPYGDDAALISYCNESHSKKWPDNTDVTYTGRNQENMMVHFPKYYHKTIERSPGIWRTYISEQQIDSDYIEEPERLVGVYEAYKYSDLNWLCSDGGVESTHSQTLATFVTQAKANGSMWSIQDYRIHATIARIFCAYYKTTNISTSNSSIPCSGGTKPYNAGKTGGTISLGNKDGRLATLEDSTHYSTSFLGLEDCYYSKWEFVQGINILKGKYVVYDGGSFPNKDVAELEAAGATNIRVAGYEPNPAATGTYNGWTKAIVQGKYGDVLPTAHGGSETTYYSDYSWFNPTGNKIFLRSGYSGVGSRCGVFVAHASNASSASGADISARLAFYGKIVVVDSDTFKKMQA